MNMADYIPRKQRTMAPSEQRLIVAAREEKVFWRGEDIETFKRVYEETQEMRKIGARAYREGAIKRLKDYIARI